MTASHVLSEDGYSCSCHARFSTQWEAREHAGISTGGPLAAPDVAAIAGKLTKAQRDIIKNFPMPETLFGDIAFVDYQKAGIKQRRTRAALTNSGITECYARGPVTIFSMVRLTRLGLQVRNHLASEGA